MAKVMQQNNNALDCVAAIFCKVMRVIANVHVIFFTKVLLDCTRFDDVVTYTGTFARCICTVFIRITI